MGDEILERNRWTQDDFELMGWHDNKVYAIVFNNDSFELSLDIDYICKWVKKKNFLFWVAPATLIFKNVYDINICTDYLDLTILDIQRDKPSNPKNANYTEEQIEYNWTIETTCGEITFISVGFTQYIRQSPVLIKRQNLSLGERRGISFDIN